MTTVSDTGPINYLVLLGKESLLKHLYGDIRIPFAVWHELRHSRTPHQVRNWLAATPDWLVLEPLQSLDRSLPMHLGAGEYEAICLAAAKKQPLLLVDDLKARRAARQRRLSTIGTLGILIRGADAGLLDLAAEITHLRELGFRAGNQLFEQALSHAHPPTP